MKTEGSCLDVNLDTFVCVCRDGYFGVTCETSIYGFPLISGKQALHYSQLKKSVFFSVIVKYYISVKFSF